MGEQKPNVLMVVENNFPADSRVRKEAYHLKNWYRINVIAIKRTGEKTFEDVDGIRVIRIPELPDMSLGKIRYILEYFYFTFLSLFIFICTLPFKRYKVVHVHNPPDTLFVVGLFCKLFGVKFIFDHHDLSPNLYMARFSGREDLVYKIMIFCEKMSCKIADVIIATNETYKEIEIARHKINPNKIHIVRNNPISSDCVLDEKDRNKIIRENRKVLLFIGAINPQDGVDILLKSINYLVTALNEKDFVCIIIGGGDSLSESKQITKDLNLEDVVSFTGTIYDRKKIKEYFYRADIGVEPAPANELNMHSTFIKIMEYMAAGIPIVAFDLKETRFSAGESAILIKPGDIEGFACAIQKLLHDAEGREKLGSAGSNRIKNELNWDNAARNLKGAYDTLSL